MDHYEERSTRIMNLPSKKNNRYVRVPIPLKHKSNLYKKNSLLNSLVAIHKRSIEREKKKLGVNDYGLLWLTFFRGVIITIIIERLILN